MGYRDAQRREGLRRQAACCAPTLNATPKTSRKAATASSKACTPQWHYEDVKVICNDSLTPTTPEGLALYDLWPQICSTYTGPIPPEPTPTTLNCQVCLSPNIETQEILDQIADILEL